jgi:hypothetical protein
MRRELAWAWSAVALAFGVLAVAALLKTTWWLQALPMLVVVSIAFCLMAWDLARFGVLANLLVLVLGCVLVLYPGGGPAVSNPLIESLWRAEGEARVRLRMHGEIKIGGWHPFVAEQVIDANRGMVWAGTVSMYGLPVVGADQVIDGVGRMSWKLFGLAPVAVAEGEDVSRSALGRLAGEMTAWLPGVMLAPDVRERTEVKVIRDANGTVTAYSFPRWGNPDGGAFRYVDFGVMVQETKTFGSYVIPTRIRAGWYFGTERFEREGEFFRAVVDAAEFR